MIHSFGSAQLPISFRSRLLRAVLIHISDSRRYQEAGLYLPGSSPFLIDLKILKESHSGGTVFCSEVKQLVLLYQGPAFVPSVASPLPSLARVMCMRLRIGRIDDTCAEMGSGIAAMHYSYRTSMRVCTEERGSVIPLARVTCSSSVAIRRSPFYRAPLFQCEILARVSVSFCFERCSFVNI